MIEDQEIALSELLKEVRRIEIHSRRLVSGVLAGGYVSVFRGAGIEFDEVREYAEGDDPRLVDWNVTARVGRPFVKKFVDERELTILFVVDLSRSMSGGFGLWSLREAAARLAGCLAISAIRNNDKVGFVGFTEKIDRFVAPKKGAGHALRIVRDCLALRGSSARSDLGVALDYVARVQHRHAVVFVISDFFVPDGWQKALAKAKEHHDIIAVRLSPPELTLLGHDLVALRDLESGRRSVIDPRDRQSRDAFAARLAAARQKTEDDLKTLEVDLLEVPLPRSPDRDAIVRPLLRFFRTRERRGRLR